MPVTNGEKQQLLGTILEDQEYIKTGALEVLQSKYKEDEDFVQSIKLKNTLQSSKMN